MSAGHTSRRTFLKTATLLSTLSAGFQSRAELAEPWAKDQLIEPSALADRLKAARKPTVICVAFPVLYRQRHIPGAILAGPASKPEGLSALTQLLAKVPKTTDIVIYCGCCPMVHCPNVGPAYQALKDRGYANVQVLNLPVNFHTDWVEKGYPVEPPVADR